MTSFIANPYTALPPDLIDRIHLVVSQDNSCRYCYGVQRAILRIHGLTDADIERLVRDGQTHDASPAERAAMEFARRVSRADPSETDDADLQVHVTTLTETAREHRTHHCSGWPKFPARPNLPARPAVTNLHRS